MQKLVASTVVGAAAAASCSGSSDPTITAAVCYHGSAGALGLKENIDVTMKDFANSAGHFDVKGDGILALSCADKAFTKSGQEITSDLSDCLPSDVTISDIKYCSDQDTVKVTVKDKSVPLPISATLSKVACGSSQESAIDQMFSEFQEKFAKQYNGDEEERKAIFAENIGFIVSENRKDNSYTVGVGPLADVSKDEYKAMLGFKPMEVFDDLPYLGEHESSGDAAASVDWTTQGAVTAVKNQGQCGSCWSFSSTGGMEGAWQIATSHLISLSEQQLVDCSKQNHGCNGGSMGLAFNWEKNENVCTEDSYPYTAADGTCKTSCTTGIPKGGVTGYKSVGGPFSSATAASLKSAIQQQPVSIAIEADQSAFQHYTSGVLTGTCGTSLDHGVLAVGYGSQSGQDYWLVKNSWGASWGEKGYVKLEMGNDECGILQQPVYPTVSSSITV